MDAMQKRKRITYLFEEIDGKIKINMDEQGNVIMEGLVSEIKHIDINL